MSAFMDESIARLLGQYRDRRVYRTLDANTLAYIADDKLALAIVGHVHARLEGRHSLEPQRLAALAVGVRALYMTWLVETQVIDGGFSRYYRSAAGQFASEAVTAFEFFGAHQHASLMREANRLRAEQQALEATEAEEETCSFFDPHKMSPLHWLDDRFYKLDESLSALRIAKIRSAPALFLTPG